MPKKHAPAKAPHPVDFESLPGHSIRRLHQIAVALFLQETQAYGVTVSLWAPLLTGACIVTLSDPSDGAAAAEVPEASLRGVNFPAKAFYLLSAVGLCASSSEARRQIQGGAVKLDGTRLSDPNQPFAAAAELEGKVLQLGKKTFRRLVVG